MKFKKGILLAGIIILSFVLFGSETDDIVNIAENYPYKENPLMATVFGTPSKDWYKFKKNIPPKKGRIESVRAYIPEKKKKWNSVK